MLSSVDRCVIFFETNNRPPAMLCLAPAMLRLAATANVCVYDLCVHLSSSSLPSPDLVQVVV